VDAFLPHPAALSVGTDAISFNWPIWRKEVSKFPWSYDSTETCYFLDGQVTVTPDGGTPVTVGKGDLVTFPQGMSCTWDIHQDVKKHYNFAM